MNNTMKALVLYGPNDYKVESAWPLPELKPGYVLVKVAYCGICGSDQPRFFVSGSYHSPMIIGHEFSGTVAAVNPESTISVGTPVAVLPIIPCGTCNNCLTIGEPFHCQNYQFLGSRNDGGFAEYCLVPETNLFFLDSEELLMSGAFIEPLSVALHTVRRSGIKSGNAIVFGAGPIGLSIACWLKYFGIRTTIVDIREYSLNIARKFDFDVVCDFDSIPSEKYDAVFEACGNSIVLTRAIELLKDKGSLTIVGRSAGDTTFSHSTFEKLMRKEITLNGCWGYNLKNEEKILLDAFHKIDVTKMISHVVSLDESIDMLTKIRDRSEDYCKVLIKTC